MNNKWNGKKCIIINSSNTFENRIKVICKILIELEFNVTVVCSDFKHIEKKKRHVVEDGWILINTIKYYKNISIRRLISHYKFSLDAYKEIQNKKYDILYIVVPPNSQATLAKKYLKRYPDAKIIMDIIDLWPESFPIKGTKFFPFSLWGKIRDNNLKYANYIVTECNIYQERLKKYLEGKKVKTIYWMQNSNIKQKMDIPLELDSLNWNLCYLGSINNIIDIDTIVNIIKELQKKKPVILRIIGGGESKEILMKAVNNIGASIVDYGKSYDAELKCCIFNTCHYGLNIMKSDVCIGMSMKSIEYINAGLPIINNVKGDLWEFIEKYEIGINYIGKFDDDVEQRCIRKKLCINELQVEASISKFKNIFECVLEGK